MNFKNLSYKQKCQYLLWGTLLFLFIAYMAALSNTMALYSSNNTLRDHVEKAKLAPVQVNALKTSLAALDNQLSYYIIDTLKNHENTLEIVSEFCQRNRLMVKELPRKEVSEEKDFTIETSIIHVEGRYNDLLKLVYELEQKHKIGRLSSVSFKLYRDNLLKRNVLVLIVYIQNIRINNLDHNLSEDHEKV